MPLENRIMEYEENKSPLTRLPVRSMVQILFLLWAVLVAFQFRGFVHSLSAPTNSPLPYRPPSVEAFLPISSLMSLTYLVKTGVANRVHPAGLVIFVLTLLSALTLRSGFCSWVCPIGTISEYLFKAGRWLFGRNLSLPKWLDLGLRSVKYLLLAFFLYIILPMPAEALRGFIHGSYNRMAEVKMYLFFANVSTLALTVMILLAVLSLFIKNFWCRYGCPYGALLGLTSRFSPLGIRRDSDRCLQCRRCDRSCPNSIRVSEKTVVRSEECRACYSCLEACPRADVLRFGSGTGTGIRHIPLILYALLIFGTFAGLPWIFSLIGYWETDTSSFLYRHLFSILLQINHPSVSSG